MSNSKGKNHLIYKMGGETNCNIDISYDKLRYKAKAKAEDDLVMERTEREYEMLQYQNTLGVCNHVSELIGSHSASSRHVTYSRDQLTLRKHESSDIDHAHRVEIWNAQIKK
eukprot:sb/3477058/